jgi:5-formaminoimidazole-4-carboxamide-1-(beta)-D-ribofuranosyl 5'-monophosphate synthetase
MTIKDEINSILRKYDKDKIAIGTLGSHSALNIFKGAKEEDLKTVCVCKEDDEIIYKKFPLADQIILVRDFKELLNDAVQEKLRKLNTILVPHGSFTAYISTDDIVNKLYVPLFGNRELLRWEASREKQKEWLLKAGLTLPRTFDSPDEIQGLVIAKFPGAKGGRGYFLANSPESFHRKAEDMVKKGHLKKEDLEKIHLQEYVIGVNVYPHYFNSLLENEVEFLGVDRRYESSIDNLGRIPADEQLQINISPTYTIVGNIPITLRESLLSELFRMGDSVAKVSKEIAPPGIIGPFCLETVITDDLKIYTFEISARIVAGTNVGIGTSPYTYLKFGERMWMGKRIAREIKKAIEDDRLEEITC